MIDPKQNEAGAFRSLYTTTNRSMSPPSGNSCALTGAEWADEILQKIDGRGFANVKGARLTKNESKLESGENE